MHLWCIKHKIIDENKRENEMMKLQWKMHGDVKIWDWLENKKERAFPGYKKYDPFFDGKWKRELPPSSLWNSLKKGEDP